MIETAQVLPCQFNRWLKSLTTSLISYDRNRSSAPMELFMVSRETCVMSTCVWRLAPGTRTPTLMRTNSPSRFWFFLIENKIGRAENFGNAFAVSVHRNANIIRVCHYIECNLHKQCFITWKNVQSSYTSQPFVHSQVQTNNFRR